MQIKNRLGQLLEEKQINLFQLHQLTGIAYHVLDRHKLNIAKRIDYRTLEKVCEALNCKLEEFFEVS